MTPHSPSRYLLIACLLTTLTACNSSDSDSASPESAGVAATDGSGSLEIPGQQLPEQAIPVDSELLDDEQSTDILIPALVSGSDPDRVVQGLTRQAASTLLELNRLVSGGEILTEQQEQCLGTFEEGLGEPLLAVNCDPPLATGEGELLVGEAAFYNTAGCREALFNQDSEGCVLERMTLTLSTRWVAAPADQGGNGRPQLVFAGAVLSYAINEPVLNMQSNSAALTGAFSCNVELNTASMTGTLDAQSCSERVNSIADEIELIQSIALIAVSD